MQKTLAPLILGHPLLRESGEHLTMDEIFSASTQSLCTAMQQFVIDKHLPGISAIQIGIKLRIIIFNDLLFTQTNKTPIIMINPQLKPTVSEKITSIETSITTPGLSGEVERYNSIEVNFLDQTAKPQLMKVQGQAAVIIQHLMENIPHF